MIFAVLGRFADKYRFFILAFWLALTAILTLTAPSLSQVGITDQSQFLPQDTESARARDLLKTKFMSDARTPASSATIIVYNGSGLTQQDMDRAKSVHDWLVSQDAPKEISGVTSVFDKQELRSTLVSKDGTTMLMTVDMSVPSLDEGARQTIKQIRAQFDRVPGTQFYLSGNTGLLNDLFESVQNTIDRTTLVTVILVIILLLLVYRSPIAALVPLVAIGCSFLVTRGTVGFLAQAGASVSTITDAYLVVTIFGVGTDYCLFIISRFREELGRVDRRQTVELTMRRIGPIIIASATTVIIAFLCLGISRFGMTRTSGWALAIGIAITLAAGLTLVPALMSLFGRYLFWPARVKAAREKEGFGWGRIGRWVAGRSIIFVIPIVVVLALPYLALPRLNLSANVLTQIPENVESARGFKVLREHFPAAEMAPLYLLVQSPGGSLLDQNSLQDIDRVAQSLSSADSISRVDYFSAPAGQLLKLSAQVRVIGDTIGPALDITKLAGLQSMSGDLQNLAINYPGVTQSQNFTRSISDLTQVSGIINQLRAALPADSARLLPQLKQALYSLADGLTALSNEFKLNGNSLFIGWLKAKYFSTDGATTRINLILKADPYSDAGSKLVTQIREQAAYAINNSNLKGAVYYIGGDAAIHADMLQTSNTDFVRVVILSSIGILAVIIILLRSLLAPLYMVATVLFNFGATLGITSWLFLQILHKDSLLYMLPVFVFVMLVAVGADYNIFLVSRIREEAEQRPIKEAVQRAVAHTGGVITSCGIILAGTFGTLATSSLPMVLQIGTGIAIGVLVDTFVVRALLVPSLAALIGRWSWWPSRLFKKT